MFYVKYVLFAYIYTYDILFFTHSVVLFLWFLPSLIRSLCISFSLLFMWHIFILFYFSLLFDVIQVNRDAVTEIATALLLLMLLLMRVASDERLYDFFILNTPKIIDQHI